MADKTAPGGNSSPRPRVNPVTGCPLTAALAAIGGKWKMIMTQQLRELQADTIVHRRAADRRSQPVVYSLTTYGRSLVPLIEDVRRWGRAHLVRQGADR